ncbi:MAG: 16S rRNA (cytosine(1402)-N(4))-methyltransferase RsmH [Burkholderiaceae bacterium]|jgi:16S rRNA (cytosine1402-N4)-methyltransferase
MDFTHTSVLLEPTVQALIDPMFGKKSRAQAESFVPPDRLNGIFVDGTFGRGGHSRRLLEQLGPDARLLVFDKDPEAIQVARALQAEDARVTVVHDAFGTLPEHLQALGIEHVNGVMLDLGVSSPQIDDASRGFSFMRDGPLDMRMNTSSGMTAAQWLAQAGIDEIREVIANYGEERFAFQIAKAIVNRRESRPLCTTLDLAELVASAVRTREKGQHPATRTFQAIRIHINEELQELARALAAVLRVLAPGGRLAVISFHSLEDRMVKQCIAAASRPQQALARLPIPEKDMPRPVLLNLGRVLPAPDEARDNSRARSAVLRVAERTATPLPDDQGASFVQAMQLLSGRRDHGRRRS